MLFRSYRLGKALTDFFFPQFCIGCGHEGEVLCTACAGDLKRLPHPYCPRCGLPQEPSRSCRDCAGINLAIDSIRSPLVFQKLTREAMHRFKYQNTRVLGAPLAGILFEYLNANPVVPDMLVPVPLHPRRLRERGYNQSLILARELGALTGFPVCADTLLRRIYTPPQARSASAAERFRNMNEAFMCENGKLKGKRLLLIDDVSTSGATLDACATALKKGGASVVWGLTVAREV